MDTGKLTTYQVSGNSMNPLLCDGDRISVLSVTDYKVGDVVAAVHPIQTDLTIVKQIKSIMPDGRMELRGVNTRESTDNFGLVAKKKIIGKMITKLD